MSGQTDFWFLRTGHDRAFCFRTFTALENPPLKAIRICTIAGHRGHRMCRLWTNTLGNSRGTMDAIARGMIILCIIGGVWLGGSALLMVALALAARRPTPLPEGAAELKQAA
jgi:hypothetical protein